MALDFEEILKEKVLSAEQTVCGYLPEEEGFQKTVLKAMNYSVEAGGKRLRPIFMREAFLLYGGKGALVEPFMAAMEMIHTYSLVHDDLPAMDNDIYRRGRYTTWKVYGEAMGVLAGDGLLNYAYETALRAFDMATPAEYEAVVRAMKILTQKAGVYGMIGGQTVDVEAEGNNSVLSMDELLFIHEKKTAALIQAGLMVGAALAGADEQGLDAMERLGMNVGLAFQIQDDILDVIGDSKVLGKEVGSDAKNEKVTYVTLRGLEESKRQVELLSEEAVEILKQIPGDSLFLEELIYSLIHREK